MCSIFEQNLTFKEKKMFFTFTVQEMNDIVQFMNYFDKNTEDHFKILRKIQKGSKHSQRKMADELGFSLGKLNYCLKSLQEKGLVKISNFNKKRNKVKYLQQYILTPKGISLRTKLTLDFMKRKIKEYDELKKELK